MDNRYKRNKNTVTEKEQEILALKKCAIVGCGGLGEYIAQLLLRLGVLKLSLIDADVFDETNLNRQLFSTEMNIGKLKTEETKRILNDIDKRAMILTINEKLTQENGEVILKNHDLVFDALDSISDRIILQQICEKLNLPLVSGSIAGWYGQITFIYPGDKTLSKIYKHTAKNSIDKKLGNPAFSPALIASWQVSEALKYFLNKGNLLRHKLMHVDLLDNELTIIDL